MDAYGGAASVYPTQASHTLYATANYTIATKGPLMEEDPSVEARMMRIENEYQTTGMRRTVEAVILTHDHRHPHILLLQIGGSFFKLPGNQLNPGEDEVEGLKSRLNTLLGPAPGAGENPQWEVGELVAVWWRPKAENYLYPYVPAHITKPREQKKLFLIQLPERCFFHVPKNLKLMAVPLMDLYDNPKRYGALIASIPQVTSRINFTYA